MKKLVPTYEAEKKSDATVADVLIIGAGLTGLALAYFLKKQGREATIVEGRLRVGGRIHTLYNANLPPREMGATWLGKKHTNLTALLDELNLETFEQALGDTAIYEPISTSPHQLVKLPPNETPSYRIEGGTGCLIDFLANHLKNRQFRMGYQVISIQETAGGLLVKTDGQDFRAKRVVSTLPPYLFQQTIAVHPELPAAFQRVAKKTHTWMGESIKVSLSYRHPFWREAEKSGTIFSNVGPITEMYDHSDVEEEYFALKGFFNGAYHQVSRQERREMCLTQLEKYLGPQVRDYLSYDEMVWNKEPLTHFDYEEQLLPHQNNGHPVLRRPYLDGRLFIAGTETADQHPGYMDGAVRSAKFVAELLAKEADPTLRTVTGGGEKSVVR